MSDDMEEFVCNECGFTFSAIWNLDLEASMGGRQICFCPRCGEELPDKEKPE